MPRQSDKDREARKRRRDALRLVKKLARPKDPRDAEIISWAISKGWTLEQTRMEPDEFGNDPKGFFWHGPGGEKFFALCFLGVWKNGPEVPDQLRAIFDREHGQ